MESMSSPADKQKVSHQREKTAFNKLQKRIRRQVGNAIRDFRMVEQGDLVMVCLSGGKDSYTLLDMLQKLRASAPIQFDLIAVNLDQKQPGFPVEVLPNYLESIDMPYKIVNEDTYSIVKRIIPEDKTYCSLCSRLRRGILYRTAETLGATKIALGHHRDDILETLFLNLFHGGKIKAMPPKLRSDDGKHTVIRPLAYCTEKDIAQYAKERAFPIIPCSLCGSQDNLQRQVIKEMLQGWGRRFPGRLESIFTAVQNISPSQLADRSLYDFVNFEGMESQNASIPEQASESSQKQWERIDILSQ